MIYSLRGRVALCLPNFAVIECGGVGYQLIITGQAERKLANLVGEEAFVFTYMNVTENEVSLFGFAAEDELEIFKLLKQVSGVGSKTAIAILTQMTPEKFAIAVGTKDAKAISKTPGVGNKIAQRIILELKDKIAKGFVGGDLPETIDSDGDTDEGGLLGDAIDTLIVLGYKRGDAMAALKKIDVSGMTLEDVIKEALNKLSK